MAAILSRPQCVNISYDHDDNMITTVMMVAIAPYNAGSLSTTMLAWLAVLQRGVAAYAQKCKH